MQSATNYPLVRITQNTFGTVTYAKTHNHSTMAVATGSASVSTLFDIPSNIPQGASTLQVVANGIPSNGVAVNITGPPDFSFAVSGPQSIDPTVNEIADFPYSVGFQNGLGGTVNLSFDNTIYNFAGSPALSPPSFTSSGNGDFTFYVAPGTTPGDYQVILTATDGTITHIVTTTLTILPPCC